MSFFSASRSTTFLWSTSPSRRHSLYYQVAYYCFYFSFVVAVVRLLKALCFLFCSSSIISLKYFIYTLLQFVSLFSGLIWFSPFFLSYGLNLSIAQYFYPCATATLLFSPHPYMEYWCTHSSMKWPYPLHKKRKLRTIIYEFRVSIEFQQNTNFHGVIQLHLCS